MLLLSRSVPPIQSRQAEASLPDRLQPLQLPQWWRRERSAAIIMDPDHKIKTRNFLVTVFRTFDVSNDGRLSRAEVDRVLAALGRR